MMSFPLLMMAIRRDSSSASSRWCVVRMMQRCSLEMFLRIFHMDCLELGSSPELG